MSSSSSYTNGYHRPPLPRRSPPTSTFSVHIRLYLGNVDALADHGTSAERKHKHDRVKFEQAGAHGAEGNVGVKPSLARPVAHQHDNRDCGRDGRALKVLALAGGVLGQVLNRDVESREAREAAEHKEREDDRVEDRAESERERARSGGHSKRDL